MGVTVGTPFTSPQPPDPNSNNPDEICVWLTNDGENDEKVHVSLYDMQIPPGGASPSNKAKYSTAAPTQEVTVPAKKEIKKGTITATVGGSIKVCWKVKPIPGKTYWVVAGNKLDGGGDVQINSGSYGSFTAPTPNRQVLPGTELRSTFLIPERKGRIALDAWAHLPKGARLEFEKPFLTAPGLIALNCTVRVPKDVPSGDSYALGLRLSRRAKPRAAEAPQGLRFGFEIAPGRG